MANNLKFKDSICFATEEELNSAFESLEQLNKFSKRNSILINKPDEDEDEESDLDEDDESDYSEDEESDYSDDDDSEYSEDDDSEE